MLNNFGLSVFSGVVATVNLIFVRVHLSQFPFEMGCFNPAKGLASNIVSRKITSYCWVRTCDYNFLYLKQFPSVELIVLNP